MPVGQNKEAAIVGDQLEPTILGGEVPANPGHVHRTSELPQRCSAARPIGHARWPRTRGFRQSWPDRPGSDAAPLALCSAALRAALLGEHEVLKGVQS